MYCIDYQKIRLISYLLCAFIGLVACEKEITANLPQPTPKLVVEGSIETGNIPMVTLTQNHPYFSSFNLLTDYPNSFVHNAQVSVYDGVNSFPLQELCLSALTPQQLEIVKNAVGIEIPDTLPPNFDFCIYTNLQLIGKPNTTYTLQITTEQGSEYEAVTYIPPLVSIDSIWFKPSNNAEFADSLRRLFVKMTDPDTIGNFYRYFTQRNAEPIYPGLRSVYDDAIINGLEFYFPLDRAQPRSIEFDIDNYGFFRLGDTVQLKWCTINQQTYNFWQSIEYQAGAGGGPFSNITKVVTNIHGKQADGLGIWAGYGVSEYNFVVKD